MGRIKLKIRDMKVETLDIVGSRIDNNFYSAMFKTDSDMKYIFFTSVL